MRYHEIQKPILERYEDRVSVLDQWRNDPSIYVSFTDLPKIGIKPTSEFDTPLGIYAYPLKEMFKYFENDQIPFADDREYIQVLQSSKVTELSKYSEADLERDVAKLKERFGLDKRIWDIGFDTLHGHLHRNGNFVGNVTKNWDDREAYVLDLIKKMNQTGETFDFLAYSIWGSGAKIRTPAGKMWNITRELVKIVSGRRAPNVSIVTYAKYRRPKKNDPMAKPAIIAWNAILRWLGYQGFSDKAGTGLIHSNEPISAVFLSSKAFRHIRTIHNRNKEVRPERFVRLKYMTDFVRDKKNNNTVCALVLQEWPKLIDGQGERIAWVGHEFHENLAKDFPQFMVAVLRADFARQFPIVMQVLDDQYFFKDPKVVDAVLRLFDDTSSYHCVEPSKKLLKTFLKVMFDDYGASHLAFAIEQTKGVDEQEAERTAARFIVKSVLGCAKCTTTEFKDVIGETYWRWLTRMCPEGEMFDGVDSMHDDLIEIGRNPMKHLKNLQKPKTI